MEHGVAIPDTAPASGEQIGLCGMSRRAFPRVRKVEGALVNTVTCYRPPLAPLEA